jgi:hypothetical protein
LRDEKKLLKQCRSVLNNIQEHKSSVYKPMVILLRYWKIKAEQSLIPALQYTGKGEVKCSGTHPNYIYVKFIIHTR